jgi:hypothetical protein
VFFVLLLTLIIALDDRFRPVSQVASPPPRGGAAPVVRTA